MQIIGAPNPYQVAELLKRLPEWTPLPGRPFDDIPKGKQSRLKGGNKHETLWAVRAELIGCIEKLPARQRDAIISCGIKGLPSEVVEKRWGISRQTVWRDQRRAWRSIAEQMGWRPAKQRTMAAD